MRLAGDLRIDGDKVVLQQGGNATTITSNSPASDVTLTLPATTDSLVGRATTDTLTNKTLTSPKINEDVVLTATATELNQLDGVTVGGTSAGDIVSIDGAQTLTNKTIVAASNTITTAASGNLASTELNAALAELQGSIDVRVLTSVFDLHVDDFDDHAGSLTAHGASGAVVGTNNTQTLLNKTLTNPKINDTIALTATSTELNYVKNVTSAIQTQLDSKASTATLTSHTSATSAHGVAGDLVGTSDTQTLTNKTLTDPTIDAALVLAELSSSPAAPAAGFKKIYAKDDGKLYTLDSDDVEQEVGSGASGGSGINYLSANPSAATDTTGWSTTGTMTVERIDADHADAANRPRANTTGTCFKASGGAADDYAAFDFTLDDADERAANLLAKLAATVADASTWKVQLFGWSDSARTLDASGAAGDTEIRLVDSDSSGNWFLAATTAEFRTFWTPNPSLPYMQLRIVDTVGGKTIYFSDTLVGPGDASAGSGPGPWQTYTPTYEAAGTVTTAYAQWRTNGENVEVMSRFTLGTTTASSLSVSLPNGWSTSLSSGGIVGEAITNATDDLCVVVSPTTDATKLYFGDNNSSNHFSPVAGNSLTSGNVISFTASIPVSELVGRATLGTGTNRVEYAADDGTNDVFGPNGALVPNVAAGTGSTLRDFSFPTNAQSTDLLIVEIQDSPTLPWTPVAQYLPFISGNNAGTTNFYGIRGYWTDATTYRVQFGNQGDRVSSSSTSAGATPWSTYYASGARFRVRKASGGVVTGYGQATADSWGLTPPRTGKTSLTVTGTNWTTAQAYGWAYQDTDGNWHLKFRIAGTISSAIASITLTVDGVTFLTGVDQAITAVSKNGGSYVTNYTHITDSGTSTIALGATAAVNTWYASGDVELDSKPTWA